MSTDNRRTRERFSKWQNKTHDLFSNFNNLFIGLSIGSIAFLTNKLSDKDFAFNNIWSKLCFIFACLLLLFSAISGVFLSYNRLNDFRKTTQKIKSELDHDIDKYQKLSQEVEILGQRTWRLFAWHIHTFVLGKIFLFLYFPIFYHKIIF